MARVFDKSCRRKTQSSCSITFSENHAVYEIMWTNMLEPDKPQVTI